MELATKISLDLKDSSYNDVEIKIEEDLTVLKLKEIILEKYNSEQADIISDKDLIKIRYYTIMKNDGSFSAIEKELINEELDNENTNLFHLIKRYKIIFLSLLVINGNIYRRLYNIIKLYNSAIGYGYATFDYIAGRQYKEGTLSYTNIKKKEILTFTILNKNKDGSINVKMDKPHQLNWGRGPTSPQRYFKIIPNNISVYYTDNISNLGGTVRFPMLTKIEDLLVNGLLAAIDACKWEIEDTEDCAICMDRKATVCFNSCKHVVCCENCCKKLTIKICPVCRQPFDKLYLPVTKFLNIL